MRPFVVRCLGISFVVAIVLKTMGTSGAGWGALLGAALFLGLLNAFARTFVLRLQERHQGAALAFVILALNALFLVGLRGFIPVYVIQPASSAVVAAALVSLVSWPLNFFFRGKDGHVHSVTEHPSTPSGPATT